MEKGTKISYLHDPDNDERVMTLVSRLNSETNQVEYGYAVNRPTEWRFHVGRGYETKDLIKGDQFNRARGRTIAEGRMHTSPLVADLAGRTPTEAILETLRDASENSVVRRICQEALYWERSRQVLSKDTARAV